MKIKEIGKIHGKPMKSHGMSQMSHDYRDLPSTISRLCDFLVLEDWGCLL